MRNAWVAADSWFYRPFTIQAESQTPVSLTTILTLQWSSKRLTKYSTRKSQSWLDFHKKDREIATWSTRCPQIWAKKISALCLLGQVNMLGFCSSRTWIRTILRTLVLFGRRSSMPCPRDPSHCRGGSTTLKLSIPFLVSFSILAGRRTRAIHVMRTVVQLNENATSTGSTARKLRPAWQLHK